MQLMCAYKFEHLGLHPDKKMMRKLVLCIHDMCSAQMHHGAQMLSKACACGAPSCEEAVLKRPAFLHGWACPDAHL